MRVSVDPRRWARWMWAAIVVLTLLSLAGQYAALELHHDKLHGFVRQFDLDLEANVPSWYQGSTLLVAAFLFALIASLEPPEHRRSVARWRWLAVGFTAMSLDEIATFHEYLRLPMSLLQNAPGFHVYSWIYPALGLVAVLAFYFRPWLRELPVGTRNRFLLAGAVYVAGAVGFEGVAGLEESTRVGGASWNYVLLYTAEEVMEMVGVLLLIQAQLDYLHQHAGTAEVSFGASRPDPPK